MSGYTKAVYEDYLHERVDIITRVLIDQFIAQLDVRDRALLDVYRDPELSLVLTPDQKRRAIALMYMLEKELDTTPEVLITRSLQYHTRYGILRLELEQCVRIWGERMMEETTSE